MSRTARLVATVLTGQLVIALAAQEPVPSPVKTVAWRTDLDATLLEAKLANAPVLVFFTASWCGPCKELKEKVCSTEAFSARFAQHRCVLVDIDSPSGKVAKAAWEVGPIPDLRFVSPAGVELGGFVGGRSLEGVIAELVLAEQSGVRELELRRQSEEKKSATALLALGEHLLQRPTKRPALAVLEQAAAADTGNAANVQARVHWHAVGARMHPIGRRSEDVVADAERRLQLLDAMTRDAEAARPYALAVRAWLQWNAVMRDWSAAREQNKDKDKGKELPLSVAQDAPLRATLAALTALAVGDSPPDTAGDGILIDGLLHYYAGDYDAGIARLERFTKAFKHHRWQSEGVRFLGICERLKQKAAAEGKGPGGG